MDASKTRLYRHQSTMEYLMTYGWAILIITIVIVSLFELGLFNPSTFKPRAIAGSCQVIRPDGPGTSSAYLIGTCLNQIPQSTSLFVESSKYGSSVMIPSSESLNLTSEVTVAVWVKPAPQIALNPSNSTTHEIISKGAAGNSFNLRGGVGSTALFSFGINVAGTKTTPSYTNVTVGNWYFVVGVYNGSYVCLYVNGNLTNACTGVSGTIATDPNAFGIGTDFPGAAANRYYNGTISNVQIYNTALSKNDISVLYGEGIGGNPVDTQHIVGWWPLNGDTNDYSGNNNDGISTNVTFTSNWDSGYSAP